MRDKETTNNNSMYMSGYCSECSGEEFHLSEKMLCEIVQKGRLKASDLGRINDPNMPEAHKVLLRMMMK